MKMQNLLKDGLLLVPVACAALALMGYGYVPHVAVPVACGMLIACLARQDANRSRWLLIAALAFSIAGDWFLKHRDGGSLMFVYGIALFFVAHAGFLAFCLKNGKIRWLFLLTLLAGYGLFFVLKLAPAIADAVLLAAVCIYTLISCFSLAAAPGLRLRPLARWLFFAGIACIVFSDTLIALHEFLNESRWWYEHLMMPAYYAAHILIAASIVKN
jgi:uncharacterized membrane protein YhhN